MIGILRTDPRSLSTKRMIKHILLQISDLRIAKDREKGSPRRWFCGVPSVECWCESRNRIFDFRLMKSGGKRPLFSRRQREEVSIGGR
jgi:hypothetical protein